MVEIEITDDERLSEVGRILAAGAMRLSSKKRNSAAKSRLAGGEKTGLIVSEEFASDGCYAKDQSQTS